MCRESVGQSLGSLRIGAEAGRKLSQGVGGDSSGGAVDNRAATQRGNCGMAQRPRTPHTAVRHRALVAPVDQNAEQVRTLQTNI